MRGVGLVSPASTRTRPVRLTLLGLTLLLLAHSFRAFDFARAWRLFEFAGPGLALVLLPIGLAVVLDTLGWWRLLGPAGTAVNFGSLLKIRVASEAVHLSVPAGPVVSDSATLWLMQRGGWFDLRTSLYSVVDRKLMIVLAHGLVLLLGVAVGFDFLTVSSVHVIGAPGVAWLQLAAGGVLIAASSLLLVSLRSRAVAEGLGRWIRAIPFRGPRHAALRLRHRFRAPWPVGAPGRAPGRPRFVEAVACYLLFWVCEACITLLILHFFRVHLGFREVLAFDAGVALVRSLAFFLPAGLGVQEIAYLTWFQAAQVADPVQMAAVFSLVRRGGELLCVLAGMVCWVRLRRPLVTGEALTA